MPTGINRPKVPPAHNGCRSAVQEPNRRIPRLPKALKGAEYLASRIRRRGAM